MPDRAAAPVAGLRVERMLGSTARASTSLCVRESDGDRVVLTLLERRVPAAERAAVQQVLATLVEVSGAPGLLPVLRADVSDSGRPFLVTPHCSKPGLAVRGALRPFSAGDAIAAILPAARGLLVAHAAGITHGRIRPVAFLTDGDGASVLADLGVRTLVGSAGEQRDEWTPPEGLDAAGGDRWGLAAVLYLLLAGHSPRIDATPSGLPADLGRPDVPQHLEDIVLAALDEDAELPLIALVQALAALAEELATAAADDDPSVEPGDESWDDWDDEDDASFSLVRRRAKPGDVALTRPAVDDDTVLVRLDRPSAADERTALVRRRGTHEPEDGATRVVGRRGGDPEVTRVVDRAQREADATRVVRRRSTPSDDAPEDTDGWGSAEPTGAAERTPAPAPRVVIDAAPVDGGRVASVPGDGSPVVLDRYAIRVVPERTQPAPRTAALPPAAASAPTRDDPTRPRGLARRADARRRFGLVLGVSTALVVVLGGGGVALAVLFWGG